MVIILHSSPQLKIQHHHSRWGCPAENSSPLCSSSLQHYLSPLPWWKNRHRALQRVALAGFASLIPCCMLRNCSLTSKVISYFKWKKGKFGLAQTFLPMENKGKSRASQSVTWCSCLRSCIRGAHAQGISQIIDEMHKPGASLTSNALCMRVSQGPLK